MNNTVTNNLKKLREQCGFNQSQIANFIGVDQSLISKIESGDRKITIDVLEKLCTLYGITMSEIHEEDISINKEMSIDFRTTSLSNSDLVVIANMRKIALNLQEMNLLDKVGSDNG